LLCGGIGFTQQPRPASGISGQGIRREQRVGMLHAQRLKPTIATLKYHPGRVRARLPVGKAFPYRLSKLIEYTHLYFHDVEKISRLVNYWFLKKNHQAMF